VDDDANGFIDDVHGWNFANDGRRARPARFRRPAGR
jgi:hypothetical protein